MKTIASLRTVRIIPTALGFAVLAVFPSTATQAQQTRVASSPPTVASTLDQQLSLTEREFVAAAEAMPEDKYSFRPANGEYKGVRTFLLEVRHVATSNNMYFNAIFGQTFDIGPEGNGPVSLQTKAEILNYLRESFALGHRAIATLNAANMLTPVKTPPRPFLQTPLALVAFACAHANDHYGQMVEYLRMNGIVPPASRNSPPKGPE